MTFGFSSMVDALSWIVVLALGMKIGATLFVLIVNRDMRDLPGWGSILWWTTKITPLIAVPCLLAITMRRNDADLALFSLAAALFVVIAVPLKIRQRRARMIARSAILPTVAS